jgi:hypothetical protein
LDHVVLSGVAKWLDRVSPRGGSASAINCGAHAMLSAFLRVEHRCVLPPSHPGRPLEGADADGLSAWMEGGRIGTEWLFCVSMVGLGRRWWIDGG